jgi:hypothetical protein
MWPTVSLVTLGALAFLLRTVRVLRTVWKRDADGSRNETAPPA